MEIANLTWRTLALSMEKFTITVFYWVDESFEPVTGGVKLRTRKPAA